MKNTPSRHGFSGIRGTVTAMIIILGIVISACLVTSGCSAESVLSGMHSDSGSSPTRTAASNTTAVPVDVSGADVSASDVSPADTPPVEDSPAAADTDVEIAIPRDHEDVIFANYKSPYYIIVYTLNCSVLVLGKDENGKYTQTVKTFLCSTGSFDNETSTNNGVYDIVQKLDWRFMMDVYGHYCTRIGEGTGYLFHSVPYLEEKNLQSQSIGYDKLGTNASHGCVRLCSRDAKWIYDNIPFGTQVRVLDGKNGPPGEPVPMRITGVAKYRGWDPTDPSPNNPYKKVDPSELTYFTHTSAGTEPTTAATKAGD